MKFVILVSLALAGIAAAGNQAPSFTWIPESGSEAGVPHLAIHFHDGKPDDIAILERFNPIPKQPHETEESIDKCIFRGHLLHESNVHVVLTGGCPFEDTFDIQFNSARLEDYMFQSIHGEVKNVPSLYKTKGLISDIALKPPAHAVSKDFVNPPKPSNAYSMNVLVNYDGSFAGRFGGDSSNVLRRVTAQAASMYLWDSLDTAINWSAYEGQQIGEYIQASEGDLNSVGRYNNGDMNSNVYLCSQNDAAGVVGIAWVGTICSSISYRTAVVEYFQNDLKTAEIMAHEVGHNTGMNHDFNGAPGNPRYDSQGRTCTNIGGVMDYYGVVNRWSTCSNEDFRGTSHGCLGGGK